MDKIATVESMTSGQAVRISERFQVKCRKDGVNLHKDTVQSVLDDEMDMLIDEMFGALRTRVERRIKLIVRRVKVDRSRTAAQVIDATSRTKWYMDEQVLAEMPLEGRAEDNVEFFELDYDPTVDELDREYETRGLRPDPAAVAQAMTDDPAFADERSVGVQWRDKRNRACYAIFYRLDGERRVYVLWDDNRWGRNCRFAGVRK